jgi:hypothetical protein
MSPNLHIINSFRHQSLLATDAAVAASVIHLMKTEQLLMDNIRSP